MVQVRRPGVILQDVVAGDEMEMFIAGLAEDTQLVSFIHGCRFAARAI
jgi:hypothetical protein